ncbi:tetratricopeptide repeat protein [Kitasatospora kifunensis]|uniref:Tetratricopeptide (TPR) repeat protein n=1 Tax=Kitasatospora kifunensis TaxID=58351 RepID=A0A7W7R9W3_KITKI|nr:tetratricopeptide repeat protein [Kitasatospora kifunensis]MBB4928127.1 tetratricopeptide (TPR) repeat protein [Kitasatospora kifunensis]
MPDPDRAGDLAEFIGLLGELRAWAGMPSYRALAKRAGPFMRPARVVSPFTVVDAFKTERRRLDLDLVVAIVQALGVDNTGTARWRDACVKAHGLAKQGGPVGVFGQLPADLATFTGRADELAWLIEAATRRGESGGTNTAVISAIEGMGGVGKTQLAIHAAHRLVRDGHFTDTQLYVNLRGFDPDLPPADPSAVLEAFLRQLGVAAQQIPAGRDERAAMYRDRLRERSALVLLDNAADEEQVRDLIPPGPSCMVLITSRRSLAGLDGVTPHLLGTFTDAESLDLLARITGRDRVAAEPEAASRIVQSCGRLPLALALAAARLRSRPSWTLTELANRLEAGRLDGIRAGGRSLRPVLELSYRALPVPAQQMFRLLGLHPGPDFTAAAAAALTGVAAHEASGTLEMLQDEHLLQQHRSGRYELHDLLRAYALELTDRNDADARQAALVRITSWYAHSAYSAETSLGNSTVAPTAPCEPDPAQFDTRDAAFAWLDAEESNLEHVMRAAADAGLHHTAWQTGLYLDDHFYESGRMRACIRVNQSGAESARKAGDRTAEGRILCNLGWCHIELSDLNTAESCMRKALALCHEAGDQNGTANALNGLGKVLGDQNKHGDALDSYRAALTIYQQQGKHRNAGSAHSNIGTIHFQMNHYDLALASYLHALEILDSPDTDSYALVLVLGNIAEVHLLSGSYEEASTYESRRLALARQYGHTQQEAQSLLATGDIHAALGHTEDAHTAWAQSATLYEQLGDPAVTEARQRLSQEVHAEPTRA